MAYTGPFPHANSGSVSAIIVSATSFTGNVGNTGKIAPGDATNGAGIEVDNNSTINGTISNDGAIDVTGDGVVVTGAGSYVVKGIVNGAAGTIAAASATGILVEFAAKFAGGIDNAGSISAAGVAVEVQDVSTFAGGINNTGKIDGGFGIAALTVTDLTGGVSNSGAIDSTSVGISLQDLNTFTGTITNNAAIVATQGTGISISRIDFLGDKTFSGTISNSGLITANKYGLAIQDVGLSHFSGAIDNSARITAAASCGIFISAIADSGNFAGVISNGGAVTATSRTGIVITNIANGGTATFSGNIANTGTIQSRDTGLYVNDVGDSLFSGVVEELVGHGRHTHESTFVGGITNSGAIASASATAIAIANVADNGAFIGNIANSGSIVAKGDGLLFVRLEGSHFSGNIANSGAITSTDGAGINISSIAVAAAGTFAGTIANSGIVSAKATGINLTKVGASRFSGDISNSGAVTSIDGEGIAIMTVASAGTATFAGNIANSGKVTSEKTGVIITGVGASRFLGGIANSGAVTSSDDYGIEIADVAGNGTFAGTIATGGAISAQKTGLLILDVGSLLFSGGIANSSAITSSDDYGIEIADVAGNGTFAGTIANGGAISAQKTGLIFTGVGASRFSGDISNSGAVTSINGEGIAIMTVASVGTATFAGNIANSGKVTSEKTGVIITGVGASRFLGDITNSGAITSSDDYGIAIADVAENATFAGKIANSGAISAQKTGLLILGVGSLLFSGGIANSGAVTSSDDYGIEIADVAGNGTFAGTIANGGAISAQKTGLIITGVGASRFSGDISNSGAVTSINGEGIAIMTVASAGTATFAGNIANSGAISAALSGLNISDVGASRFSGTIANRGAIKAEAGDGIQISSVAGSGSFIGNITNSGAISASTLAIFVDLVGAAGFAGTIANSGKIATAGLGIGVVDVADSGKFSGSIVNAGSLATVNSGVFVSDVGQTLAGGVTNSGLITAQNDIGLVLRDDANVVGNVVNAKTGTIVAPGGIGIEDSTITGEIIDEGSIVAANVGINIDSASKIAATKTAIDVTGATLTGGVSNAGEITGKIGIDVAAGHGVSVFDEGSITGSGGPAVLFKTGGNDFTLGSGYQVTGDVVGTGEETLQLGGSGAASFDLAVIGAQYKGFNAFSVVGGTWSVSGSGGNWNVDAGEMIVGNGAVLSNSRVLGGGTAVVSSTGVFETTGSGAAIVAGDVTDNGTMLASGAGSILEFTEHATVTGGGTVEIDNGLVRVQGDGNESVTFEVGGSGGLQIDDDHAQETAYTGTVTSFGGASHDNHAQYIDLTSVTFVSGGTITGSFTGTTLTVSSGGSVVAEITFAGGYATADFNFISGAGDTVEITDPGVHHSHHGRLGHSANIGLLGNYIAGFADGGPGGLLITSAGHTEPVAPLLVHPHG